MCFKYSELALMFLSVIRLKYGAFVKVILACSLSKIVEHGRTDNRINSREQHSGMTRRAITKDITLCSSCNKQMRAEHLWAANKQGTLNQFHQQFSLHTFPVGNSRFKTSTRALLINIFPSKFSGGRLQGVNNKHRESPFSNDELCIMYRLVFVATRKRDEVARKILIMHIYARFKGST